MSIFQAINTSASALTAQRVRMDVISSNMANMDTTRGEFVNGEWQPYRRKMVVTQPQGGQFSSFLNKAMGSSSNADGDETPFELIYDPEHPDANGEGYVAMPNVDPLKEMVDLISSTRSYEANVTAMNATKGMLMKALEIGK
jgi:flagellar basal-body rod protein FlgC